MDLNVSLYLDKYLSQFPAIAAAKEILDKYNEDKGQSYADLGSQEYYKDLLESKYSIFYNMLNCIQMKPNLTYESWFRIAFNAYTMKGLVQAIEYIFKYFNIEATINYDQQSLQLDMTIISYASTNTTLFRSLLTELLEDLLYYYGDPDITISNLDLFINILSTTEAKLELTNTLLYGTEVTSLPDEDGTPTSATYEINLECWT